MTRTDDSKVPDYQGRLRLDGRGFVVLGAGQGIGRQATHALAGAGATCFCVDIDEGLARDIAAEVGGVAGVGDATTREDATRLFDEADRALSGSGGIRGVVDIIGMAHYGDLLTLPDSEWDWHHDIVLRHAFLAVQLGGQRIVDNGGGSMTFVASISGRSGAPRHAAYGAAKAGLISLVQSAALELGPSGVRVNAVAPGVVWTPRVSAYLGEPGRQRTAANAPLQRVAEPSDIAGALLFLSSDLAGYVSGQVLTVDGGVAAKFPYPMDGL